MKALRFLPLVYIVGVHGFVFFAPYIALLLAAGYALRRFRKEQPKAVPVRVRSRRFPFLIRRD
jgi:hypothetical protein